MNGTESVGTPRGRPPLYRLDLLLPLGKPDNSSTSEFTLTRGVDYAVTTGSIINQVRNKASKSRLGLRVGERTDESVTFIAYRKKNP